MARPYWRRNVAARSGTALPHAARPRYTAGISYLDRVLACTRVDLAAFVPWYSGGAVVGRLHAERVPIVLDAGPALQWCDGRLELGGGGFRDRSDRIAGLIAVLIERGELRPATGEMYAVAAGVAPEPLLQIDRTAVAWLGVRAHGIHVNGWVASPSGPRLWVARRSRTKRSYPGCLDNLVAGGQPIGLTTSETLAKECHEEAGIPPQLAHRAAPAGTITYVQQDGRSCKPDVLSCFDLELRADFVPQPIDGEVEAFELWPLARLAGSLRGDGPWKPNSALVALDFLLRTGAIDEEVAAAERWRLWTAMRVPLP
jgi:8-oxo-dGTP pyrophosphatase MutT (NUDIX family)